MLTLWKIAKVDSAGLQPVAPWLQGSDFTLDLVIFDDLSLGGSYKIYD